MDKDYMNILKKSMDDCIESAYKKGLNDAWECAKKLVLDNISDGGLSPYDIKKIFNEMFFVEVFKNYTPQQAIDRIKEYEEQDDYKCPYDDGIMHVHCYDCEHDPCRQAKKKYL